MTIEAKSKILGIPFSTRTLTHIDGEMRLGTQRETDLEGENLFTPTTFRVLSNDQLAIFPFYPETKNSRKFKRGKPEILTREEINKAKLHTDGIIYRVNFRWKPT